MEATRHIPMRNITPSLSRRYREKNFVAGTWMHCTLLSLEKPPRLVPWRTAPGKLGRAHSTGEPPASTRRACATTGSRIQSTSALPAPAGISNSDSEFSSCLPYSGVDSAFPVGGWQRLAADQRVTPGSRRPEFRCFSIAEQDSQQIRCCGHSPVGSQPEIAPRREGREDRRDQYRNREQYDHRLDHDDRR